MNANDPTTLIIALLALCTAVTTLVTAIIIMIAAVAFRPKF
jgi:hypothetical protein